MKILLVNVTCKKGSTGKIVYDLYTQYRKDGHEAAVCYGRGKSINEPGIYKIAGDLGVYLHALGTRLTGYVGYGNKKATGRLIRYIKKFAPDVVHLHNIHGYYVHMYDLLNRLKTSGIPVVWTLHDESAFTGKCGHPYDCEGWNSGCGGCPQKREYPKSWFFDRTAREYKVKKQILADFENIVFAPVSDWIYDKAVRSPVLSQKNFQVVNNGIDLDIFKPYPAERLRKKHNLTNEKVLIHVTPNFDDPRKGGRFVIDLARRLADENIVIFIIGASKSIENCPPNVTTINKTENQERLAEYYSLGDAFLMTSEMENLPTVCLESVCCGTPVIGFDRGGARETAPDGYGVFVPYGDMDALESAVKSALFGDVKLKNREECAQYGKNRYDKNIMAKLYMDEYKKLSGKNK